jgi:hypothetical protein
MTQWLTDVPTTGNLQTDIEQQLSFVLGLHQTEESNDETRSMARMYVSKILEKHIVTRQLPDRPYTVICNMDNNPVDQIRDHQLHIDFIAGDVKGSVAITPQR